MAWISCWYFSRRRSVSACASATCDAPSAGAGLSCRSLSPGTKSALGALAWNTLSTSAARSAGARFSGTFWPLET